MGKQLYNQKNTHVVAVDVRGAELVERFGGGHGNGGGATDGAGGGHSAGAKLGLNDRGASGERGDGLHHTGVERSGGVAEIKFDATCSHTLAGHPDFVQASRHCGGRDRGDLGQEGRRWIESN